MKVIKDSRGREWVMNLTFSGIEVIRAQAGIDLLDLESIQTLDGVKVAKAIAAACKEQIDKAGITAQDFIDSFDGDTIEAAGDALWEELTRFFPKRRRDVIQKVTAATKNVLEKQLQAAEVMIGESGFEDRLAKVLNAKSGNSLASLASTPAPSPTDSSE